MPTSKGGPGAGMPRIVEPTPQAINEAAAALRSGDVVAFATETVYGLGADTFNESALMKVYDLKGRPRENPLIAHVLDEQQARSVADAWDDRCAALVKRFWPGPLTLVVPKAASVPIQATAGYPTVAVRCPNHPVARQLLAIFGGAISAPSANRSGRVSPTTAKHVADDFADVENLLILDGGPCDVGIESTVLDMTRTPPVVLRPGSIGADVIGQAIGERVDVYRAKEQLASPGTASAHYAPRTPVTLLQQTELAAHLDAMGERDQRAIVLAIHMTQVPLPHALIAMPSSANAYAAQLYDALRRADAMNGAEIVIELPAQPGPVWDAIRNRLHRAAK